MRKSVRRMLWWFAIKNGFSSENFKNLKRRWSELPWQERERVRKQFEASQWKSPKEVVQNIKPMKELPL